MIRVRFRLRTPTVLTPWHMARLQPPHTQPVAIHRVGQKWHPFGIWVSSPVKRTHQDMQWNDRQPCMMCKLQPHLETLSCYQIGLCTLCKSIWPRFKQKYTHRGTIRFKSIQTLVSFCSSLTCIFGKSCSNCYKQDGWPLCHSQITER